MEPQGGVPNRKDLKQFSVVNGSELEAIRQSFYDFQLYPTAGQTQLTFFSVPTGGGLTTSTGAVGTKTFADTNMPLAGQLPRYWNFLLQSIEIVVEPGSVATANTFTKLNVSQFGASPTTILLSGPNDVDSVRQTGWLEFLVSSKVYLREAPIGRFPQKAALNLDAALATNSSGAAGFIAAQSAKFGGRPYYVEPWVVLPESANFSINLNWPAAVATPSGFNARIGVILDGILYRATQ